MGGGRKGNSMVRNGQEGRGVSGEGRRGKSDE